MNPQRKTETFDQLLLSAIDDALSSLGEYVKTSIYFHLADKFSLQRQEIPHRLNDFSDALEFIFNIGARNLEILIMKNLIVKVKKFNPDFEEYVGMDSLTFADYMKFMKSKLQGKTEEDLVFLIDEFPKQRIKKSR